MHSVSVIADIAKRFMAHLYVQGKVDKGLAGQRAKWMKTEGEGGFG